MKHLLIITGSVLVIFTSLLSQTPAPCPLFPVDLNNAWKFEFEAIPGKLDTMTFAITDTLIRNDRRYYFFDSPMFFNYIRWDRAGHIFQYLPEHDREFLLFDFTAQAPDTHHVAIPETGHSFDVILQSQSDQVKVPAGTFQESWHFTLDLEPGAIDDEQEIWFVPGVGPVLAYPIFDTQYRLIATTVVDPCTEAPTEAFKRFPIQKGNQWHYEIDTNIGVIGSDSMRVLDTPSLNGYRYALFDKFLPIYHLTNQKIDSVLMRVDGNQVFILLGDQEYLWYDFNLEDFDTTKIVIPLPGENPEKSMSFTVWKETHFTPIFTPFDDSLYEEIQFIFMQNFDPYAVAWESFIEKWGLAWHTFGGIDPEDYRLTRALVNGKIFDRNTVSVQSKSSPLPETFLLHQNYPNPFTPLDNFSGGHSHSNRVLSNGVNPETTIEYELAKPGCVQLVIYNVRGQRVRTLVDAWQPAGRYQVRWDGSVERGAQRVASGVYVMELKVGEFTQRRKLVLIR